MHFHATFFVLKSQLLVKVLVNQVAGVSCEHQLHVCYSRSRCVYINDSEFKKLTMIACLLLVNLALSDRICIKLDFPLLPSLHVAEQVLRHEFAVDSAGCYFEVQFTWVASCQPFHYGESIGMSPMLSSSRSRSHRLIFSSSTIYWNVCKDVILLYVHVCECVHVAVVQETHLCKN